MIDYLIMRISEIFLTFNVGRCIIGCYIATGHRRHLINPILRLPIVNQCSSLSSEDIGDQLINN